jgi:hypothetical protein
MHVHRRELSEQVSSILNGLNESMDMNSPSKQQQQQQQPLQLQQGKEHLTQANLVERRLLAWQRALQLYIYDNGQNNDTVGESSHVGRLSKTSSMTAATATANASSHSSKNLTMNQLLQHLCLASITDDEETLTSALQQASKMTSLELERSSKLLQDAVEETSNALQSYHIHLIAHSVAAQTNLKKTGEIQNKFLNHGKEALKIGHALELEEGKRYQSEYASLLLKRWWMMENLAEQENSSGEHVQVHEEVWGVIPSSSCKLDPLFTRKENSLEAAKTLKSLRTIVKCRSNVAKNDKGNDIVVDNGQDHGAANDPAVATKRFELTGRLIQRISAELEQRLLNTFSEIYSAGGTYDFSSTLAGKNSFSIL